MGMESRGWSYWARHPPISILRFQRCKGLVVVQERFNRLDITGVGGATVGTGPGIPFLAEIRGGGIYEVFVGHGSLGLLGVVAVAEDVE